MRCLYFVDPIFLAPWWNALMAK